MENNKNKKALADFPDYELVIGEDPSGEKAYQIINKFTRVTEVTTLVLPQALSFIEQLQAMLDAVRDEAADAKATRSKIPMPDVRSSFAH